MTVTRMLRETHFWQVPIAFYPRGACHYLLEADTPTPVCTDSRGARAGALNSLVLGPEDVDVPWNTVENPRVTFRKCMLLFQYVCCQLQLNELSPKSVLQQVRRTKCMKSVYILD